MVTTLMITKIKNNYVRNDDKAADVERFVRAGASDNDNDNYNLGRTVDIFSSL